MAENSHISWTNHTFNPWIGCTRVSPACDGCYAAHLMGGGRYSRVEWGEPGKGEGTRDRTAPSTWRLPRKWNKQASDAPGQTFVFCASLADVFDNAVPTEWRSDLFDLIEATPNLTWLLLTKRPQLIVRQFAETVLLRYHVYPTNEKVMAAWPRNAAIGTTIEDRKRLLQNAYALAAAASQLNPVFTFWSCEPLLEDLGRLPRVPDWVIAGGETDQGAHKARPANPQWYRDLRDQCVAAGVPFHFKQWGEWCSVSEAEGAGRHHIFEDGRTVRRIGKALDPCTLDHVRHDARPKGFVNPLPA